MSESNEPHIKPGRLPPMKTEEIIARAQRILDLHGRPPYTPMTWQQHFDEAPYHRSTVSDDEAAIITEFMIHWMPYLVEKQKGS